MASDPKQAARFQNVVQMPPLPPTPELSGHFREGNSLFAPFAKFDQQHREWARQLGLNLQQAHQSLLRAAERKTTANTQPWPDRGWCRLVRQPDGWWMDGSIVYRPNSAKIWVEVVENRVAGYESGVSVTAFNGQVRAGKWITEQMPVWVQTGAVPRTFRITVADPGTDVSRIGYVPVITLTAGTAVVRDGVTVFPEVADGCTTVVRRADENTWLAWLKSEEGTELADLHCDACHVTLV